MSGIWETLRARRRLWLPLVVMLVIFLGLIAVSETIGLVPFTYTRL
jgi:hypothetical protein